MLSERDFLQRWSALHGNAAPVGIVRGWLWISYRIARSLRTISPNAITLGGVVIALVMLLISRSPWAILLLVLSLIADGLDGSLALIRGQESSLGSLYDSLADRITEAAWAFVFYVAGAPAWCAITLWFLGGLQEYARAKVISLGITDVGVITPAERPMRASALFIALVLWHMGFGGADMVSYLFLGLQLFSVLLVVRYAHRSLQQPSRR